MKMTFDAEISKALEKVGNKSRFIEGEIRPILRRMDPSTACETVGKVLDMLDEELRESVEERDYEEAVAIAEIGAKLQDYASLCELNRVKRVGAFQRPSS